MFILPVQQNSPLLSFVVIPSSSAADVVTSLNVDPGSYVSAIALFLHIPCKASDLSLFDNVSHTFFNSSLFISYGEFKL